MGGGKVIMCGALVTPFPQFAMNLPVWETEVTRVVRDVLWAAVLWIVGVVVVRIWTVVEVREGREEERKRV